MADTSPTSSSARTWIFQANPKFFDIDAALTEMREMSWSINQYKQSINPGDAVFIWRSGPEAGIVAAATVLTAPAVMEQDALQFAVQTDRFDKPALRVRLQIDEVYPVALSREALRSALPDLSILQSPQGTNFTVSPEEAALIREMLQPPETDADEIAPESTAADRGKASRIWAYAPGPNAQFWEEFYRDGIMAIGWDELRDLSQYPDQPAIAQKLIEAYKSENRPLNATRACFDFVHSIKPGDQVIVKRGRAEVVGYGIVTGGYEFRPERATYRNVRKVRWERKDVWKSKPVFAAKTLTDFTPYPDTVRELTKLIGVSEPAPKPALPPYGVDQALKGAAFEKAEFEEILRLWRNKKNLILQGPPGVGKTFLARKLAYALIGHELPSRVTMIQFHQSYSYEDFIQGYRPAGSGFARKDGVFVRFCKRASLEQDSTYVFIIDEINRGNLSKVFGELLMLIEADKRGNQNSLALPYSEEEQFYVPPNVFVLGMMNTADRSLALVDYALRRRFSFVKLEPLFGSRLFVDFLAERGTDPALAAAVASRMEALNQAIAKDQNLGPGFRIGHSYFCGSGAATENDAALTEQRYTQVISHEIVPLLEEYWFDSPEHVQEWAERLGAKLE